VNIRVLMADDHPMVREGLRLTIERSGTGIEIVGEASDGIEVLAMAQTSPADVYILDITMPKLNGIECTRELIKNVATAKIILLSLHDTKDIVAEALGAGARGYLTKEMAPRTVVDAVIEVHAGGRYLDPRIAQFADEIGLTGRENPGKRRPARTSLTGQEKKVLQLIAEGHSNKEVAKLLNLSINTIHVHRTNLMSKLDIHKHADLVRYAIKSGLAKL